MKKQPVAVLKRACVKALKSYEFAEFVTRTTRLDLAKAKFGEFLAARAHNEACTELFTAEDARRKAKAK